MENLAEIRRRARPVLEKYGVKKAALFGSAARGESRGDSDLDLLVEVDRDIGMLEFVGLKLELERILGRKVDLVEYDSIRPALRQRILAEPVVIA